jgi:hypothetical protein
MNATDYPRRSNHFAHKFTRLLFKACVANELGPEATLLLIAVAHTEDARGYRGPVTFWNAQLMPLIGAKSESAFKRIRDRCAAAGWLAHLPGARGRPAGYWVSVPARFAGWDDGPTDEQPGDYIATTGANAPAPDPESGRQVGGIRARSDLESGRNSDGIRSQSGPPSSLSLSLSQEKTPLPQAGAGAGGTAGAGGKPEEKPQADFDPTADVNPWFTKFGELVAAWVAAKLPGFDGPRGIQETANRRGFWQMRLQDESWRRDWREAVERAGRSARCRGAVGEWKLQLDTFLKDPDMVARILEGEFDDGPRTADDRRNDREPRRPGRYAHVGNTPRTEGPLPAQDAGSGGAAGHTAADLFRPP